MRGERKLRAWAVICAVFWAVEEWHAEVEGPCWTVAYRSKHQASGAKGDDS